MILLEFSRKMRLLVFLPIFTAYPDITKCPGESEGYGDIVSVFCQGLCEVDFGNMDDQSRDSQVSNWDKMCQKFGFESYGGFRNADADDSPMRGYGCWCNAENHFKYGHGKPVNMYDHNCQQLARGYECIRMDAKEDGITCESSEDQYVAMPGFSGGKLDFMCDICYSLFPNLSDAKKRCAKRLCVVESRYLAFFLNTYLTGHVFDDGPIWEEYGGTFDNAQCQRTPGNPDKSCCGKYPYRFPYNTFTKECCEDGENYSISRLGEC